MPKMLNMRMFSVDMKERNVLATIVLLAQMTYKQQSVMAASFVCHQANGAQV